MTIEIIRGDGFSDIRQALLENIATDSNHERYFYIVPNHIKFDSEVDVLKRWKHIPHRAGQQVEVYSFSRLIWALGSTNNSEFKTISDNGLALIINSILQKDEIPEFIKMKNSAGFSMELAKEINELKSSGYTGEYLVSLLTSIDDSPKNNSLKNKLNGLNQLLNKVDDFLSAHNAYLSNDVQRLLLLQIKGNHTNIDLSKVKFVFDKFAGFTQMELDTLNAITDNSDTIIGILGDDDSIDEGDIFYKPNQVINQLKTTNISTLPSVNVSTDAEKLALLWKKLQSNDNVLGFQANLDLFTAESRETEIEIITNKIKQLVDNGYKYHDILILARDLNSYATIIPHIFKRAGIPTLIDLDEKMNIHPFAEFMRTILDDGLLHYQYSSLMPLYKSGLLVDSKLENFQEVFDQLENFLIVSNINRNWSDIEFKTLSIDDFDDENMSSSEMTETSDFKELREFTISFINELNTTLSGNSNRQVITSLLELLEDFGVVKILNSNDQGKEIWNNFVNAIDELVFLFGEEEFDKAVFSRLLKNTFSASTFSGIPSKLDGVRISESGAVQSETYKYLFFIGANYGVLPANTTTKALLNDLDRKTILQATESQEKSQYLKDSSMQQMAAENLLFFQSLRTASEHITISYPLVDSEGLVLRESLYISRLKGVLNAKETQYNNFVNRDELTQRATSNASLINQLIHLGNPDSKTLEKLPINNTAIFAPYSNKVKLLGKEIAHELFGNKLELSVSSLELYYRNSYDFFLKYGLHLKTRGSQKVDSLIIGSYYHAGLQAIYDSIKDTSLSNKTSAEIDSLIDNHVSLNKMTQQNPGLKILDSNVTYRSIEKQLKENLRHLLHHLSSIEGLTTNIEENFGAFKNQSSEQLPGLSIADNVEIRGKIDRIDTFDFVGRNRNLLLDYKTNGKDFKLPYMNAGLDLQLMTYWMAADEALNKKIDGAYFIGIQPKRGKYEEVGGEFMVNDTNQEFIYPKDSLAQGRTIDEELLEDLPGKVFSLPKKPNANSLALNSWISNTKWLIKDSANQILNGNFDIKPYIDGAKNGLQYSDFKHVNRFDINLNSYRSIPKTGNLVWKTKDGKDISNV
jgi:ATP-dependent helicase/nuclease subunit B